ncbi:hypothetical protein [Nocardia jiangsuensis]|uniref:Uncharacterized protein n=1 Tax=Nocardia jiangsuensis TaxID=1691563 RepID=A0ABV8E3A9_9NOCA
MATAYLLAMNQLFSMVEHVDHGTPTGTAEHRIRAALATASCAICPRILHGGQRIALGARAMYR